MPTTSLQAACAANDDVPEEKPGPFQDCRDVVHIAIFFDGTGNNRDADVPLKKWSNVARMFDAALNDRSKSIHRIYVSGVGTAYNGDAVRWLSAIGVWIQDNGVATGMAAGAGGTRRLEQGDDAVSDRLRQVLIANAAALGGKVAKYAAESGNKSFAEVNSALAQHRLIKVINISIFGFSRGAALARAFSNRVLGGCKGSGENLTFAGHPLRIKFMGLFDTVASFGVPSQNVRLPFEERELIVSKEVKRCVHFVAAHEVRFAFPVDLIRKNGKLAGAWLEKTYAGVHSDVGGGYGPQDQQIDNNYSRIPMKDMMAEALGHGVRMLSYSDVENTSEELFKNEFLCHPATETAYKHYLAALGGGAHTIEDAIKRHMALFFSANGSMYRQGMQTSGDRSRHESKYKYLGAKGMAWEVSKYRVAARTGKWVRFGGNVVSAYAQYVKPAGWQLAAWDKAASPEVVRFVAHFIHDSKVDFVANIEPFSYFKARGVQESTRSIWQEGGAWIHDKAEVVTAAANDRYQAGKDKITGAVDDAEKNVQAAASLAQRKATEAAAYARAKAAQAAAAARHAYTETTAATRAAAAEAAKKAEAISLAAQRNAREAAQYARQKAQEAGHAVSEASDTVSRKAGEVEHQVETIVDKGVTWIKNLIPD